jgi:hypothetical protein
MKYVLMVLFSFSAFASELNQLVGSSGQQGKLGIKVQCRWLDNQGRKQVEIVDFADQSIHTTIRQAGQLCRQAKGPTAKAEAFVDSNTNIDLVNSASSGEEVQAAGAVSDVATVVAGDSSGVGASVGAVGNVGNISGPVNSLTPTLGSCSSVCDCSGVYETCHEGQCVDISGPGSSCTMNGKYVKGDSSCNFLCWQDNFVCPADYGPCFGGGGKG